jgi:hypothetical protein
VRLRLAATAALLLASGCAQNPPAAAPSCQAPSEAVRPGAAGTLDESSTGAYCLAAGQTVDVFLHAPTPAQRWTPVASSDTDVLAPQRPGVLTAPVGVTPGIFTAVHAGTARLSSTRPNGPSWSVTVVVS